MYKDLQTTKSGIRVHITGYNRKDAQGHIHLRGYAVDADGIKINNAKTLRRTAKSEEEIPVAEQHLMAAVLKSLPKTAVRRGKKESIADDNPMARAFEALQASGDIINPDWGPGVHTRWMTYFDRHVLPRITRYINEPFSVADRDQILSDVVAEIEQTGKSKGYRHTIVKTAKNNLASADRIYQAMRLMSPDLPAIELAPPRGQKTIQPEQIKSLPREVRRKFARKLEASVESEPLKVMCAVCMWDGGARTAEAAAVLPQDFAEIANSECISLWILRQEKNGKRSPVLKSDAAYRRVPLSYWGTCMVRNCIDLITWPADDTDAPMTAKELSAWIKALLMDCGCNNAFWNAAIKEEMRNPEIDSQKKPIYDVVAYVLRRDRASRWRNVCGLLSELDYLLGHAEKKAKKRKIDYAGNKEQARIARCCERYVYNSSISLHPACRPIELTHGADDIVIPFEEMTFRNEGDTPIVLSLDILAAEAAETITVTLSKTAVIDLDKITVRHKKTLGVRENRPIIGTGLLERGDDDDEPVG